MALIKVIKLRIVYTNVVVEYIILIHTIMYVCSSSLHVFFIGHLSHPDDLLPPVCIRHRRSSRFLHNDVINSVIITEIRVEISKISMLFYQMSYSPKPPIFVLKNLRIAKVFGSRGGASVQKYKFLAISEY